jgi:UDPglucose--hexose-1-phosphate uridylyltransferase
MPPKDYCPLCPTEEGGFPTEMPTDYDMAVFENKFPSLQQQPPVPDIAGTEFYPVRSAEGICEVVLYSSEHETTLAQMPSSKYLKLVKVWKDRYIELGQRPEVEYVFIFENKGVEVGVTLHHPHGQIYAYPFVPPIPEKELQSSKAYLDTHGQCLFCKMLEEELQDGRRIVAENRSFVAFVPFFARYPYELHISARNHCPSLAHFGTQEEEDLAAILQLVLCKYDQVFARSFPYIMVIHQQPTNGTGEAYSHFHIEFYPPLRAQDRLKYLAGSEAGAGTFINDTIPEDKARELRELAPRDFADLAGE